MKRISTLLFLLNFLLSVHGIQSFVSLAREGLTTASSASSQNERSNSGSFDDSILSEIIAAHQWLQHDPEWQLIAQLEELEIQEELARQDVDLEQTKVFGELIKQKIAEQRGMMERQECKQRQQIEHEAAQTKIGQFLSLTAQRSMIEQAQLKERRKLRRSMQGGVTFLDDPEYDPNKPYRSYRLQGTQQNMSQHRAESILPLERGDFRWGEAQGGTLADALDALVEQSGGNTVEYVTIRTDERQVPAGGTTSTSNPLNSASQPGALQEGPSGSEMAAIESQKSGCHGCWALLMRWCCK